MSLVFCPECGHEVSANAAACPNCGHPIRPVPAVERKVVVAEPARAGGFPPWLFVPIVALAVILLFAMYFALRQSDDDQANLNVNVNMAGRRASAETPRDPRTVTVPPTDSQPVMPPGQTTTVPGSTTSIPVAPPPDKGTVVINARVTPPRGPVQPVKSAKFFLLDEDIESILSKADIDPIEGNSLTASLGLAVVYPDKYGEFYRSAMKAINAHVKYSGTTDSKGAANMSGISPSQYFLFGITRVGRGFALWNSPVSIVTGENVLNLSPQNVIEIPESSG